MAGSTGRAAASGCQGGCRHWAGRGVLSYPQNVRSAALPRIRLEPYPVSGRRREEGPDQGWNAIPSSGCRYGRGMRISMWPALRPLAVRWEWRAVRAANRNCDRRRHVGRDAWRTMRVACRGRANPPVEKPVRLMSIRGCNHLRFLPVPCPLHTALSMV